jgi:ABC-type glycerol-3-phosphate transport system permease component
MRAVAQRAPRGKTDCMISRRRKLWIGLVLSLFAAVAAGFSVIANLLAGYAMSRSPSGERAMFWAYSSGGIAVLFAAVFLYCLVCLIKEAIHGYKVKHNSGVATARGQPAE